MYSEKKASIISHVAPQVAQIVGGADIPMIYGVLRPPYISMGARLPRGETQRATISKVKKRLSGYPPHGDKNNHFDKEI